MNIINTLAALDGTVVNELNPMMSTSLPFKNARFEALISPVVDGICFNIINLEAEEENGK